ncbi:MAG: hypothetical protein KDK36_02975 [Leptospiraceae bacterium]|nr:hypothetical protein [Leptospiraceae bacterium]
MADDKKRLFDFDKLNLLLLSPLPIDLLEGLVLEDSFLSIKKESKNIGWKKGLGGEVLISEQLDNVHTLDLKYLPNSPLVFQLNTLKVAKTQFGITLQNNSAPKYKGAATECRFIDTPDLKVGVKGFEDLQFKILMTDYIGVYLKN